MAPRAANRSIATAVHSILIEGLTSHSLVEERAILQAGRSRMHADKVASFPGIILEGVQARLVEHWSIS